MLTLTKSGRWAFLVVPVLMYQLQLHADDPPEVSQIEQMAGNAQNAGDFSLAAEKWEELIRDYPESSRVGYALLNAGRCFIQTEKYAQAADRLERSLSKLDPKANVSLAEAYLFLGFSQVKLGRELTDESPQEARKWLTTATQTYVSLVNRFPNFENVDQALFFQGEAFEALERFQEAAESYEKLLKIADADFKPDAMFALAFIRSRQGKYEDAIRQYADFIDSSPDHELFNEACFRAADALVELAQSAENLNEPERANQLLGQAATRFEQVFQTRDPRWADKAKFRQANILHRQGKYKESAKAFEVVVGIAGSKLAEQARVFAGRDYLSAGNGNAASQILEKAVAVPSPFASEAAHWLAQLYLKSDQAERAYQIAKEWIPKTENVNVKVPLMLGQADAAYALANRRNESRDLYLEITDNYPKNRLAATALYNAAYAAMETGQFDNATKLTRRFRAEYPDSDYLPDTLEVEADSHLLANAPERAETTLADLISSFESHPKKPHWLLRQGLSLYLQKKHQPTIALLQPLVAALQDKPRKAEALHWIGSSYYQLGNSEKAVEVLQKAANTDNTWRRADETLLTLSRAFYQNKNVDLAKKTTQQLIDQFPKSPLVGEASYRLGEFEYDAGNYRAAMTNYSTVIANFEDSQFAPYAMYGIGWSHLQLSEFTDAIDTFSRLIEAFPKHSLATDVLVGRASAHRQNGNPDHAITDARGYLANAKNPSKKEEAMYELGLAQIAKSDWDSVVATFRQLLEFANQSALADRYHYELAWALKTNKKNDSAVQNFAAIAKNWPDSPLAPESNFHVAQMAYNSKDFDTAVTHFQQCIDSCTDNNIKEKAIYKLAWSQYKQKDFQQALASFRNQISEFPNGQLRADALFMVSETLYEADKYQEAFQEYKVAKPVIETSKTVSSNFKILTYLHGAQSANLAKEHEQAIEFANALLNNSSIEVNPNIKRDAMMEIGDAHRALGNSDQAIEAYTEAAKHPGKTGARSMCMMGEVYFDQKDFENAINRFKLVWYGYGGTAASEKVKPWQAFAAYEAARCNLVLASAAQSDKPLMTKYVDEAKKHFNYLIAKFPNDKLAPQAKSQLEKLN